MKGASKQRRRATIGQLLAAIKGGRESLKGEAEFQCTSK